MNEFIQANAAVKMNADYRVSHADQTPGRCASYDTELLNTAG